MFGLFGGRARRERRIRERGLPARATIVDTRPADGDAGGGLRAWDLRLHVTPEASAPFTAIARTEIPAGERPAVGSAVEVLHDPGNTDMVVLAGPVPGTRSAGAGSPAATTTGLDAGDAAAIIADALGGAGDGDALTHTEVYVNGQRVTPQPSAGAGPGLSRDDLRRLGQTDPAALAHEVLRRIASGEAQIADVQMAESVEVTGDAAKEMIDGLAASGVITPEQLEQIRKHMP